MIALRRLGLVATVVAISTAGVAAPEERAGGPLAAAIDVARQRVVKLYGGGFGRERGYGSGVIISSDGQIVTTHSVLLESTTLRAVLPDGRRFPARVVRRDELRQLALLQIDTDGLPFFEIDRSDHLRSGDWVVGAANPFKVADGPEPISVAVGVFSGRAELSGRRHAQDFAYEGPVLVTDVIVATPGSAGGAVVDARGRLVGVIGKAVISRHTNTWTNYAVPIEEVAAFLGGASQAPTTPATSADESSADHERPYLGIRLFDVGGRARPAYVERVGPGSSAWQAGIRPDDLIISVAGNAVRTCADFHRLRDALRVGEEITIIVKRGEELKTLRVTVGGRER